MIGIPDFLTNPNATCADCAYGYVPPALETSGLLRCLRYPPKCPIPPVAAVGRDYPAIEGRTRACGEFVSKERLAK